MRHDITDFATVAGIYHPRIVDGPEIYQFQLETQKLGIICRVGGRKTAMLKIYLEMTSKLLLLQIFTFERCYLMQVSLASSGKNNFK